MSPVESVRSSLRRQLHGARLAARPIDSPRRKADVLGTLVDAIAEQKDEERFHREIMRHGEEVLASFEPGEAFGMQEGRK